VDLNRAPRETLLRVPGLGLQSVKKMLAARRVRKLRLADLTALYVPAGKILPFVVLPDHRAEARAASRLVAPVAAAPAQQALPFA